jgi:hypothetical protein
MPIYSKVQVSHRTLVSVIKILELSSKLFKLVLFYTL